MRLKLTTNINIWYRVVDLFFMFPKPQKRGMLFVLYFFGQINNMMAILCVRQMRTLEEQHIAFVPHTLAIRQHSF